MHAHHRLQQTLSCVNTALCNISSRNLFFYQYYVIMLDISYCAVIYGLEINEFYNTTFHTHGHDGMVNIYIMLQVIDEDLVLWYN